MRHLRRCDVDRGRFHVERIGFASRFKDIIGGRRRPYCVDWLEGIRLFHVERPLYGRCRLSRRKIVGGRSVRRPCSFRYRLSPGGLLARLALRSRRRRPDGPIDIGGRRSLRDLPSWTACCSAALGAGIGSRGSAVARSHIPRAGIGDRKARWILQLDVIGQQRRPGGQRRPDGVPFSRLIARPRIRALGPFVASQLVEDGPSAGRQVLLGITHPRAIVPRFGPKSKHPRPLWAPGPRRDPASRRISQHAAYRPTAP